jgi:hypothetical protein
MNKRAWSVVALAISGAGMARRQRANRAAAD